jgi:hypothetical protein
MNTYVFINSYLNRTLLIRRFLILLLIETIDFYSHQFSAIDALRIRDLVANKSYIVHEQSVIRPMSSNR